MVGGRCYLSAGSLVRQELLDVVLSYGSCISQCETRLPEKMSKKKAFQKADTGSASPFKGHAQGWHEIAFCYILRTEQLYDPKKNPKGIEEKFLMREYPNHNAQLNVKWKILRNHIWKVEYIKFSESSM